MDSLIKTVIALIASLLISAPVSAALIFVNTTDDESNDDGDCSLREAVRSANENTSFDGCVAGNDFGTDSIFLFVTGNIQTQGILITQDMEIIGPGMDALFLDANRGDRHFVIMMEDLTDDFAISQLTLTDGEISAPGGSILIKQGDRITFDKVHFRRNSSTGADSYGGAIATALPPGSNSRLEFFRCIFEDNVSDRRGGAIAALPDVGMEAPESVTISESEFVDNIAHDDGGAVSTYLVETLSIDRTVFAGNLSINSGTGAEQGGAVDASDVGLVFIRSSTFKQNEASASGGAISLVADTIASIENSTFYDNNSTDNTGNAISARFGAVVRISHSTLVGNDIPARNGDSAIMASEGSQVFLSHSIVFSDSAASEPECDVFQNFGSFTSLGYNIDASGTCTSETTDIPMTDPRLAPLGDYGDDTDFLVLETFLPLNGPARDGGQGGTCQSAMGDSLGEDQRGEPRTSMPRGNKCDIGAVEFQIFDDPNEVILAVNIPAGNGRITSTPSGIDCPADCDSEYLDGTLVKLKPTPDPGFQFSGWTGDCTGSSTCEVVMDGNRDVAASFSPIGIALSVTLDGPGSGGVTSMPAGIDCITSCSATFPAATIVDLTAIPSTGSAFQNWTGACTGASRCNLMLDQDENVGAVFIDAGALFVDSFE